jgi:hypothetical protein
VIGTFRGWCVASRVRTDQARFLVFALVLIVLWLMPQAPARAAMMRHHDLSSLALESDAIVLARVTGVRSGEGLRRIHTHVVVESLVGELAAGEVIELDYGALRLAPGWENEAVWTPEDEVVLFLRRAEQGEQPWRLVGSGLRIFVDDITYRFEQHSNPGPYAPVPQGDDPYDVFEDPRGREPLTRAAFELELRAAIERAAAVRRDLAAIESPEARARLLEVVGPAWGTDDDEPCVLDGTAFFEDLVSTTILDALWAAGDTEAFLEGFSRVRGGVEVWRLRARPEASWLLASGSERERPLHLRVAALRVLAEVWWVQDEPSAADSLVPLLEDPEPSIRAAAAFMVEPEDETPSWRTAIVERLRVESDPSARYALAELAAKRELLAEAGLADESWPVVSVERRGRAVEFRWFSPQSKWSVEAITVTARPGEGEPQSLQLQTSSSAAWMDGIRYESIRGWLLFAEPLPEGRVDLELVAVLRQNEQTREVRLDVRPLGLPPEQQSEQPAEIAPTPVPAGCACTTTGSPAGSFAWLLLVLAVCLRMRARFLVLALVLWIMPQPPARAEDPIVAVLRPHHDLSSLAFESDAIVLARVTSGRASADGASRIRTHVVVESLFGEFAAGEVIELDYGALRLAPRWSNEDAWTPDDEVVLFLERVDGDQSWRLVDSGLRIFVDDITYRFQQSEKTEPYHAVPQGDDPYDVFGDPRGREPLTRAAFELELRAAIERAAAVRRDLAAIESPEARARLLEVIGPAWGTDDDEPHVIHHDFLFEDRVSMTILQALRATGEFELFLEGCSRLRGGVDPWWRLLEDLELSRLLVPDEWPLHLRVAALHLLADALWMTDEPTVANSLVPLIGDAEPSIRAAAVFSVGQENATPSWRAAIVEQLRVESDPAVRYALVEVALNYDLLAEAGLADEIWPVVMAERRGRLLEFSWRSPESSWKLETLTVTARPHDGEPQLLQLVKGEMDWTGGGVHDGFVRGWLFFAEPLPEGRVDLELFAELRRIEQWREVRLDVRPLGMPPPPPFVNLVVAEQPSKQPSEIAPTPVPSGCACTATGSPAGSFAWFVLALAVYLRMGSSHHSHSGSRRESEASTRSRLRIENSPVTSRSTSTGGMS